MIRNIVSRLSLHGGMARYAPIKSHLICLIVLMSILLIIPAGQAQDAENIFTFYETDCPFNNTSNYQIDCGYVTMPENHDAPDDSRLIHLQVAIIRSPNVKKAPDPVLHLDGGPGGREAGNAPSSALRHPLMAVALQNRDVIVVDQRGMGLSQPTFNCTPFRSPMDAFDPNFTTDVWIERMADCPEQFESQGIDWTLYNSRQNALDLSMIPFALGYDEVNLYGVSYGTLLGQIILRENPTSVRSVILDSVLALDTQHFGESVANFDAAFRVLEEDCNADITCRLAYPDLRQQYVDTYERLLTTPDEIVVDGVTIPITASGFADRVRFQFASHTTIASVPAFITAFAERDYDVVLPFIKQVLTTDTDKLPNQVLYLTMVCPEGVGHITYDELEAAQAGYPEVFRVASSNTESYRKCQAWDDLLPFDTALPVSDIPTLLLAGRYDPLTPTAWAHHVAENLSNSYVVEHPYAAHVMSDTACGQVIAYQFLNDPAQQPDTFCIEDASPPGFILMTTVTRRPVQIATGMVSIIAIIGIGLAVFTFVTLRFGIAWRASFRRMGWLFPLVTFVLLVLLAQDTGLIMPDDTAVTIVQALLPLFMALQAAAIFSPDDEPALEIQLASARPFSWLLVERLAVVFMTYIIVGTVGSLLLLYQNPDQNTLMLLIGWIPSALFLASVGFFVTVRSGVTLFGIVVSGFLWMAFGLFGDFFVPGVAFGRPLHLIQPFMWPMHLYPSLDDFIVRDFWLNRLFQFSASIGFIMYTLRQLRDPEQVLLRMSRKARLKNKHEASNAIAPVNIKSQAVITPVMVSINAIQQIMGMAYYEFKMHWSRRGIKVLTLAGLVGVLFGAFVGSDVNAILPGSPAMATLTSSDIEIIRGELLVMYALALIVIYNFMMPILLSDAVPTDKQYQVAELLNAAPITDITYLAGKVSGAMLANLTSLVFNAVLYAVIWRVRAGSYDVVAFADIALVVAIISTLATGFTVLIGATQPSNRRALFLAVLLIFVPEFIQSVPLIGNMPHRVTVLLYSVSLGMDNLINLPLVSRGFALMTHPHIMRIIAFTGVQFLVTVIIVWLWRRYRNHQ